MTVEGTAGARIVQKRTKHAVQTDVHARLCLAGHEHRKPCSRITTTHIHLQSAARCALLAAVPLV